MVPEGLMKISVSRLVNAVMRELASLPVVCKGLHSYFLIGRGIDKLVCLFICFVFECTFSSFNIQDYFTNNYLRQGQ